MDTRQRTIDVRTDEREIEPGKTWDVTGILPADPIGIDLPGIVSVGRHDDGRVVAAADGRFHRFCGAGGVPGWECIWLR